jgi:hypothetical protein
MGFSVTSMVSGKDFSGCGCCTCSSLSLEQAAKSRRLNKKKQTLPQCNATLSRREPLPVREGSI